MKKLLCIIVVLTTFFMLASCQKTHDIIGETATDTESDTEDTVATEETEPSISFLTVNGIDISEYKIVYSSACESKAKDQAKRLAEHIESVFGNKIDIVVDPELKIEKSIIISDTLPKESDSLTIDTFTAIIQNVDSSIWISAINSYTIEAAIDRIIADTTPNTAGITIDLNYSGANRVIVEADDLGEALKVMSYNVKNGYVTAERKENTVKDVTNFMPDTLGVQEFNLRWFNIFKDKGVFDEYEFVGEQRYGDRDREANDNEYSAILYRKGKFNLIDSGTYWLSETPEQPDTKLEASKYVRIMTYAVLERISDGVLFVHVNTHLNSTPELNLRQMEILVSVVNEKIYAKYGELPTFFTGDFNASPISESADGYKYLISTGTENSRDVAEVTSDENTIKNGGMIDHCIITKGDFLVTFFDVGDDKGDADTSNHYPVYVKMYIIPRE